jgi:hypothetical protein
VDPCWVAALPTQQGSSVICVNHPWSLDTWRIQTRRHLPLGGRPNEQRRIPWAVQLTNGMRCDGYQGAHSDFEGRTVDYYCGNPSRPRLVLLRDPNKDGSIWTYDSAYPSGNGYSRGPTVGVRIAWFGS